MKLNEEELELFLDRFQIPVGFHEILEELGAVQLIRVFQIPVGFHEIEKF